MQQTNLEKDKKLVVNSFKKPKNKTDLAAFVDDLFTSEEILDLAQRIKIARLILAGNTYEEIAAQIPVSTSTISKIGQIIKFGKGGLEIVCKKLQTKKEKMEGGGKGNVG